jgi:hypothetical protein
MALMTYTEVKSILGVTSTAADSQITALIPYVENDIIDYCHTAFQDPVIYHDGGTLAFVRGDTNTSVTSADRITDDYDYFTTCGFRAGMDIFVEGGSNEGKYTLAAVTTDKLTLTCTGTLEDQDQSTFHNSPGEIKISRIRWPTALKIVAAQMVWHLVSDPQPTKIQSERIDDYSVSFIGEHAYPNAIEAGLRKYKRVVLV